MTLPPQSNALAGNGWRAEGTPVAQSALMKKCPFCGNMNGDNATHCRKCDGSFLAESVTVHKARTLWIGPDRGEVIRGRALSMVVLGLLVTVYWGGYGPWPTIDLPILATLRAYLEPLLIIGGALLYLFGWIATLI